MKSNPIRSARAAIDWWDVVMSTRVNDPKTSAMVVVMQRCHQRDLSGHLLEKGGWEHLCLPAEYEGPTRVTSIGFSDPRAATRRAAVARTVRPEGNRGSENQSRQLRRGRPASAAAVAGRRRSIKRHWFRFWQPPGANLPPVMVRMPDGTPAPGHGRSHRHVEERAQSWDCSFKDLDTSDYVVGQVWGRIGSYFLLLDQVRGRMDCPATVKAVRELSAKWPGCSAKLIEDKANGSAVIQMLGREIPGLLPVNPGGGKVARAAAVSPLIEAGNVYLPHPDYAPWVEDFIEECAAFPNGAHDDQVDAMTQLLLRWNMPPQQQTIVYYYDPDQFSRY